jgi:hypothetical protein
MLGDLFRWTRRVVCLPRSLASRRRLYPRCRKRPVFAARLSGDPSRPYGEFRRRCRLVTFGKGAGETARLVRAFRAHANDRGAGKVSPLAGALRPTDRGEGR